MHTSSSSVGVIPARFQVPELHEGHRHLIDQVQKLHEQVLIVLCSSRGFATSRNPLPYLVRKHMVLEAYPAVSVVELLDHPIASTYWSRDLDELIKATHPGSDAVLYGSRDCFIPRYTGQFSSVEVPMITSKSGTDIRADIGFPTTREGREGLIYALQSRAPAVYRTADIAIIDHNRILLIGKDVHEGLLSFPGGFNDTLGESDEAAAMRERIEEVPGITVGPFTYLESFEVEDPRYWGTPDGITTSLFKTTYKDGSPTPGDDADSVAWVHKDELLARLVPWHRPQAKYLLTQWNV